MEEFISSTPAASKDEEVVDLTKKVKVYSSKSNPHFDVEGTEMEVHPKVAEKIISNGLATKEKPTKK